ncbi:hypothetical protein FOMPIDRAFT_1056827, partial [Fomitopsis schrenkii]
MSARSNSVSASTAAPVRANTFGEPFDQAVRDWSGEAAVAEWVDVFSSVWARYLMRARAPADEYLVEFVWGPLMAVARANPDRAIQMAQDLGLDILHDVVANWRDLEARRAIIEAEEEARRQEAEARREEEEAARREEEAARRREEEAARARAEEAARTRAAAQEAAKALSASGPLLNRSGAPVVVPPVPRRGVRTRQSAPGADTVADGGDTEDEDEGRAVPRRSASKVKGKAKASSSGPSRAATKAEIEAAFVRRLKCRAEAIYEDLKVCDYCATYAKTEKTCKVAPGAKACTPCLEAHKGCYWGNASLTGTRPDNAKASASSEKAGPVVATRPGLRPVAGPSLPANTHVQNPALFRDGHVAFADTTFE